MTDTTRPAIRRLILDSIGIPAAVISHDGTKVAFVRSETGRETLKTQSEIWTIPAAGGDPAQLTHDGTTYSNPVWERGDNAILAVRKGDDLHEIVRVPLDGGDPDVLTSHRGKPASLTISPDGRTLAYVVNKDPDNPDEQPRDPDRPEPVRVIRRIDYKQDSRGLINNVRQQVHTLDLESGERRQVSTELIDHAFPQWSPDGARIAVKCVLMNGMRSMLRIYDLTTGTAKDITDPAGNVGTFVFTPDGSGIVFSGTREPTPQHDYFALDLASGVARQITTDTSFEPVTGRPAVSEAAQPVWLDDTSVLVAGTYHGSSGLFRIDTASGDIDEIAMAPATRADLSIDDAHRLVVQTSADPTGPGKIVIRDLAADEERLLFDANEGRHTDLASVEQITINRDGWEIDVWVTYPHDFDSTKTYPLVLEVHGGPHNHHGYAWALGPQNLAAHGFIVASPNPRGSGTYGRAFADAVHGDWGGEDWLDQLAVVDHFAAQPWIDADRIGIYGYSYGGFMTSWAIGQTDRFKAAVCGAPVFDFQSFYGTSDIGHVWCADQWGGPLDDPCVASFMQERSPSRHIHKAVTPTLIVHGEADHRCPIGQGEELYIGLRKAGVETEFIRYPGCAHLMLRSAPTDYRIDYYTRVADWFTRHLT